MSEKTIQLSAYQVLDALYAIGNSPLFDAEGDIDDDMHLNAIIDFMDKHAVPNRLYFAIRADADYPKTRGGKVKTKIVKKSHDIAPVQII